MKNFNIKNEHDLYDLCGEINKTILSLIYKNDFKEINLCLWISNKEVDLRKIESFDCIYVSFDNENVLAKYRMKIKNNVPYDHYANLIYIELRRWPIALRDIKLETFQGSE
jgi:hypothetical protein